MGAGPAANSRRTMSTLPSAGLMAVGGPENGRMAFFTAGSLGIGRADINAIVVDDPAVSRDHARLYSENSVYWITDLGSRNGTFVNGTRLADRRRLRNRDRIQLGGLDRDVHWVFLQSRDTLDVPSSEVE